MMVVYGIAKPSRETRQCSISFNQMIECYLAQNLPSLPKKNAAITQVLLQSPYLCRRCLLLEGVDRRGLVGERQKARMENH